MNYSIISLLIFLVAPRTFATNIRNISNAHSIQVFESENRNDDIGISRIAVSPLDQGLVSLSSENGLVAMVDSAASSVAWTHKIQGTGVTDVAFSQSGDLLAYGYFENSAVTIVLASALTGEIALKLRSSEFANSFIAPKIIKFGNEDKELWVMAGYFLFRFDLTNGTEIERFGSRSMMDPSYIAGRVLDLVLTSSGEFIHILTDEGVWTWSTIDSTLVRALSWHEISNFHSNHYQNISAACIAEDGRMVIAAVSEYVYVIDIALKVIESRVLSASDRISAVKLTEDQSHYMVASLDGSSRGYRISTGTEDFRLDDDRSSGERSRFVSISGRSKDSTVFTGDLNGKLWLWPSQ